MSQAYLRVLLTLDIFSDEIRSMAYSRHVIKLLPISQHGIGCKAPPFRDIAKPLNIVLAYNSAVSEPIALKLGLSADRALTKRCRVMCQRWGGLMHVRT